jgi:hypothetical protein
MRYTPQDIIMHPLHAVPSCMSQDGMTQGGMTQGGMWARWAARWLGASRPTACLYILHHHLHATPPLTCYTTTHNYCMPLHATPPLPYHVCMLPHHPPPPSPPQVPVLLCLASVCACSKKRQEDMLTKHQEIHTSYPTLALCACMYRDECIATNV